jgi:hypothetical protein
MVQVLLQPDRGQVTEKEEALGVDLGHEMHVDADVRQRVRARGIAEEADEHEPPVADAPASPFLPDRDADGHHQDRNRRDAVARDRALEQEQSGVDEEQAGDRPPEDGLRRALERRDEGGDSASHGCRIGRRRRVLEG